MLRNLLFKRHTYLDVLSAVVVLFTINNNRKIRLPLCLCIGLSKRSINFQRLIDEIRTGILEIVMLIILMLKTASSGNAIIGEKHL